MASPILTIIEREYRERVAKKSFILTTILMPLFMVLLMALPALIIALDEPDTTRVAVIDHSEDMVISRHLENRENLIYTPAEDIAPDTLLARDNVDAVLVIPEGIVRDAKSTLRYYTAQPSSMLVESDITRSVDNTVEQLRMAQYNIDNLDRILDEVKSNVSLQTIRTDRAEGEDSSTTLSYFLGMGLTFVLYMFLLIYGQMVMSSIIEEKSSRVLEIIVTSVKPWQMMAGKIIGVTAVAATQIVIWGVLILTMSSLVIPAILPESVAGNMAALQSGNIAEVDTDQMEMLGAIAQLTSLGYIMELLLVMGAFLILGFVFYASIFAAIGSSVDNVQDAGQLSSVVTIPVIIGLVFAMQAAVSPNSPLAFWMSMIPFTSPMVMMARVPFGIPSWEIALSLVLLAAGMMFTIWLAGKIYRVGIFMYGKKPTWKELIKWARYK